MLKKIKYSWFKQIHSIEITKKITLFYGSIFSFSLLIISCFMILNISTLNHQTVRANLSDIVERIEVFLTSKDAMSTDDLNSLLNSKHIEVSIYCQSDQSFLESQPDSLPALLLMQYQIRMINNRSSFAEGLKFQLETEDFQSNNFNIQQISKNKNDCIEYVFENSNNYQYMLVSKGLSTPYGYYQIDAMQPIDIDHEIINNILLQLIFINLIGVIASVLVGRYISYRILLPVKQIRSTAERITIEDLSRRIQLDGPNDEMKELALTFNSMIDRLEKSFQRQNQFVSDASHELRTPISVIQGYANLMNRWGKDDPDILQESLDSIIVETEHMTELVKKLLMLAKTDQDTMPVQKSLISLNKIAEDMVKEFEVLEVKRKITFNESGSANIWADYNLIKQLMWIYAENAIKYTKDDDSISITVKTNGNFACISLKDSGAGISEEDLPNIFNRFYRADKSRNKEIAGTGLGLSIAKWILDTHNATVEVLSSPKDGTEFINCFPLYIENKNSKEVNTKDKK